MTPPGRRSPDGTDETPDIAMLQATDALLDRLGRREPTPDDLDDPLIASLALLGAEVDLDVAPVARTRRALQSRGQWPPAVERPDDDGVSVVAHRTPPAFPQPSGPATANPTTDPALFVGGAVAPPRALPRTPAPRPEPVAAPRSRPTLQLLPAVASAVAAVVLSMVAAAFVTGGESVNPQRLVTYVVDRIQGATPSPSPTLPVPGTAPSKPARKSPPPQG